MKDGDIDYSGCAPVAVVALVGAAQAAKPLPESRKSIAACAAPTTGSRLAPLP
jgi:hypothetical protein